MSKPTQSVDPPPAEAAPAAPARQTVERVVRESYGRLLAFLTARCGDWAAAEDALAEAIAYAVEHWRHHGLPERPEAWLLTVGRRRLVDTLRRTGRELPLSPGTDELAGAATTTTPESNAMPDERLHMLFLCCHPAIDAALHTPLMLQAVFGMPADRIASAFLVRPSTMGQRLSRAKAKMRQAGMPFALPEPSQLPPRLQAVLQAIYAAYTAGWDRFGLVEEQPQELTSEAIYLARLLAALLPGEPEAHGLLALLLYCESRAEARRDAAGRFLPLELQPVEQWSAPLLHEAEHHLLQASHQRSFGRFQLEAAIQSVHAQRRHTGQTDWPVIAGLYEALESVAPTAGVRVGRAAAVARADNPEAGLALLRALDPVAMETYQPFWALSANLYRRAGDTDRAGDAYSRAIALTRDPAVRAFLIAERSSLEPVRKSSEDSGKPLGS